MKFDTTSTVLIDELIKSYLKDHPKLWLLQQALYTATQRRVLFGALVSGTEKTILDAGCGYGVSALELAGQLAVSIDAIDLDPEMVNVANELKSSLGDAGYFAQDAKVSFQGGSISKLPFDDDSYDFVYSSFVFQHLADPQGACDELYRVTKPGGTVCLIDADDAMSIVYPEPSEAYSKLSDAFDALQHLNNGDRNVGRKLATYLDGAGFDVSSVLVMPSAEYRGGSKDDPGKQYLLERIREVRQEVIDNNLLGESDFDSYLACFEKESSIVQFRTNSQIVAIGRRPY